MAKTPCPESIHDKIELLKHDLNEIIVKFVSGQGVDVEIESKTKSTSERVGFKKIHVVTVDTEVKINT